MTTTENGISRSADLASDTYKHLASIKDRYVNAKIAWYQEKKRWPRRLHRLSAFFTIVLSVSMPALVQIDGIVNDVVVPMVAILVAVLTALGFHYQWGSVWKEFHGAQLRLTSALASWELRMLRANRFKDPEKGVSYAVKATQALLDAAEAAEGEETLSFFRAIREGGHALAQQGGTLTNRQEAGREISD